MSVDGNWIQIGTRGNSTYYYDSRSDFWRNHQNRAETYGGYLASLNDVNEYNYVVGQLRSRRYYNMWIGLTDDPANVSTAREGTYDRRNRYRSGGDAGKSGWRWMDGSTVTYDRWNGREPNDSGGEDIAHFTGSSYVWNDHRYSQRFPALIEIAGDRTAPSLTISSSNGSSGTTSNNANITINFALSESSPDFNTNDVSVSGGVISNFQKVAGNSYSATFTPTVDGSTSISVGAGTFVDDAGNVNISSNTFNWSFDTVIGDPSLELSTSSNTGFKHDYITSDATPTFSGTAEPNSSVKIFNGNTEIASNISVNGQGNWIHTIGTLELGTHSIKVQAQDIAGNISNFVSQDYKIEPQNTFVVNPENSNEINSSQLKNDTSKKSHGLNDSHILNVKDVVGFSDPLTEAGWDSVRLPSKLTEFFDFDKTTNNLTFKNNKPNREMASGLFRVFARSNNQNKKSFTFFVNPKSSLTAREEAVKKLNTWNNTKLTSWRSSGVKTSADTEVLNIFNKFSVDSTTKQDNYLSKFNNGTASVVANADDKLVIVDTSLKSDVIIVDSSISDLTDTRKQQINNILKVETGEVVQTPLGELDFSVDTIANGTAVVQLILEEGDQNINRIIKTNSAGESYLYNSQVITYRGLESDFDTWLSNLEYSLSYYGTLPESIERGKGDFTNITVKNDGNILKAFVDAGITATNHTPYIDGSAYLIDKDGDGDIEMVSAFLIDGGFFDTDSTVGLIRDPIIPVVSPIPEAPVVGGSAIVNDSTPSLSGTTDTVGNIIKVYAADGTTLLATTTAAADKSWSISDSDYVTPITDGQQILKVVAIDPITDLPSPAADFPITIDTNPAVITGLGLTKAFSENSQSVGAFSANETVTWTLGGVDANKFNIDSSGNLSFISAPDFETPLSNDLDNDYEISVIATDIANNTSQDSLTISVTDLDEIAPVITGIGATVSVDENSTAVGRFTADESVAWTLSGDDASKFNIDASGNLSFLSAPDFGDPKSLSGNNNYEVNVIATDNSIYSNNSQTSLTVAVADIEEDFTGFIDSAITYNYRIQRADIPSTVIDESLTDITGLLGYSNDTNSTRFETDDLSGGATKYNVVIEAKVSGKSTSEKVVNLDSFDTTFSFNSGGFDLFNTESASVTFGSEINHASSYQFLSNDSIRATGATLDQLNVGDLGIKTGQNFTELFTISGVTINADAAKALGETGITFSSNTNIYDTVMSVRTSDNAEIKSLNELKSSSTGSYQTSTQSDDSTNNVTIHEAYSEFKEQGTTLYTTRNIGSDVNTSLIRDGSIVNAVTKLINDGTFETQADKISFNQINSNDNFRIMGITKNLSGAYVEANSQTVNSISSYTTGEGVSRANVIDANSIYQSSDDGNSNWIGSDGGDIEINYKIKVDGKVGQSLSQLDTTFFQLSGDDVKTTTGGGKISNNLITFQGDINYDGRVSLKDLAFLNAGALNQGIGFAADDVDANFDGTISTTDLAILDRDWGGNLHEVKSKGDLISSDNWDSISNKGGKTFGLVSNVINFDNSVWENESDTHTSLSPIGIPNPLAGDIYNGVDNQNNGGSTFNRPTSYFDLNGNSQAILGFEQSETFSG